jgi:hypothetical protein
MPKRRRKIQVVERKLGRDRALGLAWHGEDLIEIDPRQTPREYLDTLAHEAAHLALPELSEAQVLKLGKVIAKVLWAAGYRRTWQ